MRDFRMKFNLGKLFIFAWSISSFNLLAFDIFEKQFFYSNQQFISTIYITKDGGQEAKENLKKFINSIFKNVRLEKEPLKDNAININEKRFYIGKDDKVVAVFKFADFPVKSQENFAKNYCNDIDCDIVFQGHYLDEFTNKKNEIKNLNNAIFTLKNDVVFKVNSNAPLSLKKAFIEANDGDITYSGTEGKIIFYKKRINPESDINYRVHLYKDGEVIPLYSSLVEQKALDVILSLTNSQCVTSSHSKTINSCYQNEVSQVEDTKSTSLKIVFKSGNAELSSETNISISLFKKIVSELKPILVTSDLETIYSFNQKTNEYVHESNLLNHLMIKYLDHEQVIATTKIHYIDKDARSRLHDFIVTQFSPTSYQIYSPSANGEILVSEHSLAKNKKFNQMVDSTVYKKYLEIGINIKRNTNEITVPSNLKYLSRSKFPSYASFSSNIEYWPFRFPIGFSTQINTYNIIHESVDLLGNVTKFEGINTDYNLLLHFKHLQNQSDHLTELQFALGLENRNFSVDDNDTVGELSTSSLIMKLDYQKWFKKFRFTTSLKINYLLDLTQKFKTPTEFTDTRGLGLGLEAKVSKKIDYRTYIHLGIEYSTNNVTLDEYSLKIHDMSFALGVSYRLGEQ